MNQVKHILVALDDSGGPKEGLDSAISLAKSYDAKITCVTVLSVHPTLVSTVLDYKKFIYKKAEEMLSAKKTYCEKQGIKFSSKILWGSPSSKITKFAHTEKVDLVVIGSRSSTGIKSKLLGSIATSIVRELKITVLVVK